jgi:signal transduction histidine kinase
VEIEVHNKYLEVRFIDQGIGISEADLSKIFDLFYRGSNKNYEKGNVVGLSIVKNIIEIHQGKFYIQSEHDKGSIFKIQFHTLKAS